MQAFSSCSEWELLFVALHRLLIVVVSLVGEHGLEAHGLQELQHKGFRSCDSWVLERGVSSCGA